MKLRMELCNGGILSISSFFFFFLRLREVEKWFLSRESRCEGC